LTGEIDKVGELDLEEMFTFSWDMDNDEEIFFIWLVDLVDFAIYQNLEFIDKGRDFK